MKNRREYHAALSAEYALGTLRGPARLRFEEQMQQDPALLAEVARWQEAFSQLDNQLTPVTPPDSVWKKIQLQLPPKPATKSTPEAAPWRQSFTRGYLGWAIAAGLAAVLLLPKPWESAPMSVSHATPVAILANANATQVPGQWVVTAENSAQPQGQSLTITPLHAAPVAADRSLELWVIPAGGKPVSLGLVNAGAASQFALADSLAKGQATLAITLEQKGGSPTGQPLGGILFSGSLAL